MKHAVILRIQYVILCTIFMLKYSEALVGRNVEEVGEDEYKNVVCILMSTNQPQIPIFTVKCTGVLISLDHVLTSEHCFDDMGPFGIYISIGASDLTRARPHYISWWMTYNMWATSNNREIEFSTNDIGIMKLFEKAPSTIIPAVISPYNNENLFGLDVVIAGFGLLENGQATAVMHKATVRIISNEDCQAIGYRILGRFSEIHRRYLCSISEPFILVNSGDSGGPVFYGNLLLGINQGTTPGTHRVVDLRKANIHCTVDYYREYIEDILRI